MSRTRLKTWLDAPPTAKVEQVLIIGAGIAGASTAHAFAKRGIPVTVLEAQHIAAGASGNHQGLLYAKITAAATAQNQLLALAYPYVLQHLQDAFADADFWHADGLLQLAHDAAEAKRQCALLQQAHLSHLFEWWHAQNSVLKALLPSSQGLWWANGARLSPPQWIQALLQHDGITVVEQCPVLALDYQAGKWQLTTSQQIFSASHVVVCAGAKSDGFSQASWLKLRRIRGQVAYAHTAAGSQQLPCNISGKHYLTAAKDGIHTFGASFVFGDDNCEFRLSEHHQNLAGLATVLPDYAAAFAQQAPSGRASIRADSIDHLPVVGPVGDESAMRLQYAKLAQDKNHYIDTPCPYLPNLWLNTAHGTRGMVTAPLCAQSVVRRMLGEPDVLPLDLQDALHPNRLLIRQLVYAQSE